MKTHGGIIDKERNPFSIPSWIEQNRSFTKHRQEQFEKIAGRKIENIKDDNEEKNPAFVAIRWGFAKVIQDRLIGTDKMKNRDNYDGWGEVISPGF